MVTENDYTNLLQSDGFVEHSYTDTQGVAQTMSEITALGNDPRTIVDKAGAAYPSDSNDWLIKYRVLSNENEFDDLNYYSVFSRENLEMPSGGPSLTTQQAYIVQHILNPQTTYHYSVTFSDVANIIFDVGSTSDSQIIIGSTTNDDHPLTSIRNILNSDDGVTEFFAGYELDVSNKQTVLEHGDVWLNQEFRLGWNQTQVGTPQYFAVMHEIAHSLGLGHIIDKDPSLDNNKYTLMTKKPLQGMAVLDGNNLNTNDSVLSSGLQLLDIAAIQAIYGENLTTRGENNTQYAKAGAFSSSRLNDAFVYTIWDGGGTGDTIDASGFVDGVEINLNEGEFSSIGKSADATYTSKRNGVEVTGLAKDNVAIAYNAKIEDAKGTNANDEFTGNELANKLWGLDGADTFIGGAGNDFFYGGAGADFLDFNSGAITQETQTGITLNLSSSGTVIDDHGDTDTFFDIENFNLTLGKDTVIASSDGLNNIIDGKSGHDIYTNATGILEIKGDEIWVWDENGNTRDVLKSFEEVHVNKIVPSSMDDAMFTTLLANGSSFNDLDFRDAIGALNITASDYNLNSYGNIVGNNEDNTFVRGSVAVPSFYTGLGNDTVIVGGSSNATTASADIYYSGGDDTYQYNGNSIINIRLPENVIESNVSLQSAGHTGIGGGYQAVLDIAGHGSITIEYTGVNNFDPVVITLNNGEFVIVNRQDPTITINTVTSGYSPQGYIDEYYLAGYVGGTWSVDDTWTGDASDETYRGLGGNDILNGGDGYDTIYGGDGTDTIDGGAGEANNLYGGFGGDIFHVGDSHDSVTGGEGVDTYIVKSTAGASGSLSVTDFDVSEDRIDLSLLSDAGSYNDLNILSYAWGAYFSVANSQYEILLEDIDGALLTESNFLFSTGGAFNNSLPLVPSTVISGDETDNVIYEIGTTEALVLEGLGGNDELYGGLGDDYLYGGDGDDYYLSGEGGNDVLIGGSGSDYLEGGTGDDYYLVDVDVDTGFDSIFDMGGTDTLVLEGSITTSDISFSQWGGSLTIQNAYLTTAWEGVEIYDYFSAPYSAGEEYKIEYIVVQDVVYDLEDAYNTGTWAPFANWGEVTITFPDVPSITQTGSSISETLSSAAGLVGEALYGLGGDDQLIGNEGDDYLYGGAGKDTLDGGDGDDSYIVDVDTDTDIDFDLISENSGTDALFLNGVIYTSDISFLRYGDTLRIASSTDWAGVDIYSYFSNPYYEEDDFKVEYIVIQDVIYDLDDAYNTGTWTPQGGVNIQPTVPLPLVPSTTQTGSSISETLTAVSVDGETLYGLGGNDWLIGNQGDDYLYGGDGDDSFIHGGSGNDVLVGGVGNDRLEGGSGNDFYIVDADTDTGFDIIWEYSGTDTLILNGNITTSDISFSSAGNTLLINSTTAWQGVNILDFFASDDRKVEYIVIQNTVYDLNDVYTTGIWTEFGGGAGDAGATGNVPNAFDDLITIDRGGVVRGNVLNDNGNGSDYDTDGTYLEVDAFSVSGAYGSFNLLVDGSFTFAGTANYVGTNSFSYTLRDADGMESTANITLNSIVTNEAPVAQNMDSVVAIQAGSAINFVPNFTDPDGDAITYSATLQNGSALPSYIVVDPATGALTGTMPTTSQATIGVRLIAADWMSQTVYDFDLNIYDTITGTAALDYLHGDAGVDIIYGGDGEDRLYGNDGDDVLHGENDNDRIYGHLGNDTIYGDSGWDLLYGLQGDDTIFGGIGNDTIRGDDASGLDGYVGAGNDELHGGDGSDNISGGAGDDLLYGDAGNDYIYGNAGNDTFYGGDDDDRLYGNAGDDELHGDAGLDRIYGHEGNDVIYGDAGNDLLYGLEGSDIIYGGEGADRLIGDDDPATVGFVDAGNDVLLGEGGNDVLGGGAGDDLLIGGTGVDSLWGNAGADTFAYLLGDLDGSKDYINDFSIADGDVINIADVIDYSSANGDLISDFVTISNGGSYVRVIADQDGTGTTHTTQYVAQVQGNTGWDLNALIDSGTLIVE